MVPREYWSPSSMMRELDRMFDDFRGDFEDMFWGSGFGRPWRFPGIRMPELETKEPLVDLVDKGNEFLLTAELPGIAKDKIDINVSENSVEIRAEEKVEKEEKEEGYVCRERSYQGFYRKLSLPEEVAADKANAEMKNGVLKVTVPKKKPIPKPKARRLEIK
ncbi:MAG: hypothetical protein A7316_02095 [Candidatus Altiarchaeales archaeon WOR_SM1_86-2]|nr:MAG: hypothetical protein A7316_02095 [Candidatus Altiarchaeales archaeon WOR_SM1_86-2]ODS41725.1 MAG: hypothetical protein A7315_00490 [Candidatus Altiarchaeales archaeon WOR_SM1_79]